MPRYGVNSPSSISVTRAAIGERGLLFAALSVPADVRGPLDALLPPGHGARQVLPDPTDRVRLTPQQQHVLLGLERAKALGATEVEVVNDSELIANQVNGRYRVKHPDMIPLHRAAMAALGEFDRWRVITVPRAQNAAADALVNQALDAAR